ncbi:MAG: hypothetical protein ACXWCY_24630 [Burkholderiales bacterium]
MVDIKAFPYLCFVRFDLVHKEFDREFNIHFDDHIQELADRPGYSTAWRTRELRGGPFHDSEGVIEQEYQQIYAIENPGLFKSFPQDPPPPVMENEPWRRDIRNWGRVFYKVLSISEKDPRAGRCWARCEMNVHGTAAEATDFQSKSAQHLKRVLELPGIHRAWQLQHAPHPAQIGPDPVGQYMNLYEVDAPENLFDPSVREDRLPLKAGQKFAGRHFARLLLKAEPRR